MSGGLGDRREALPSFACAARGGDCQRILFVRQRRLAPPHRKRDENKVGIRIPQEASNFTSSSPKRRSRAYDSSVVAMSNSSFNRAAASTAASNSFWAVHISCPVRGRVRGRVTVQGEDEAQVLRVSSRLDWRGIRSVVRPVRYPV